MNGGGRVVQNKISLLLILLAGLGSPGFAASKYKQALDKIQTVLVDAVAQKRFAQRAETFLTNVGIRGNWP